MDKLKEANAWADGLNIPYPTTDKSFYPKGKNWNETYGIYKERVREAVEKHGFDLGRLSFADYTDYCRGHYAPDATEYYEGMDEKS